MKRTKIAPKVIAGKDFPRIEPRSNKYKIAYLLGVITTILAIWFLGWFSRNYRIQSPVIVRTPIVQITSPTPTPIVTTAPTITKTPTVEPKKKAQVGAIVDVIYRLESSQGKHDPCRIKGGYNGFGMAPGTCYDSHAIVRAKVENWFDKCLNKNGYSLSHCACSYNLGPNSPYKKDCENLSPDYPYYKNLLSYL